MQRWIRHTASQASRLKIKAEWAHSNRKGLAPQKAAETSASDATRDTYQRKIFYDGSYFFAFYWSVSEKIIYYITSADGVNWASPTVLQEFSVGPYYGGNLDVILGYANDLFLGFVGSNGLYSFILRRGISGNKLVNIYSPSSGSLAQGTWAHGGSLCRHPVSHDYFCYITNSEGHDVWAQRWIAEPTQSNGTVSRDATHATGGSALLPYERGDNYYMLAICKDASNVLKWNLLTVTASPNWKYNSFAEIATSTSGFSTFSAASEADSIMLSPASRVHLVYIKSTGELCYRKFENDAWSDETVLVASGASYPVIAVGKAGRLYVFYVKDGVIKLLKFNGVFWESERTLFPSHVYDNPAYLSTNQNVQNGKICLVWTEGSASPYKVMFAYLDDRWV